MEQSLGISQGQELRQTQSLTLAQMQSMKLLQESALELTQELRQAVQQNPVLELEEHLEISAGDVLGEMERRTAGDMERDVHSAEQDESLLPEVYMQEAANRYDEIPDSTGGWNSEAEERRQHFLESLTESESLAVKLERQLPDYLDGKDPELEQACKEVLGNLDERGWLRATDEEIATSAGVSLETARRAVKIVQSLEPAGLGGRDLREVLLLQLDRANEHGDLAYEIVDRHLEELGRNHIPQIAKALDAEVAEIQEAAERIRSLNPYPGSDLSERVPQAIVPDFVVRKDAGGSWVAYPNGAAFPEVRIVPEYEQMRQDKTLAKETRSYLSARIAEARQLMQNLDFRKSTLGKITEILLVLQKDFFERGKAGLKPLVMGVVAELMNIHEATVSRAIANKYMDTPWGVVAYRDFFTKGYTSAEGEAVSSKVIRLKLREMIAAEDPKHPLSDQKLADQLAEQGFTVARRTVLKYRELEGIPAASLRRQHI